MTFVILFVLGAILGSFLNVVAMRLRSGLTLMGRSKCLHCHKTLGALELVPIVSFIFLKGRCSACQTRIPAGYFLVEVWMGLILVSLYQILGLSLAFVLAVTIFGLYVVIAVYDARHKIIPDELVYATIVLGVVSALIFDGFNILDWLAGPILALFFALIWYASDGRAMGFGDVKLGLSIGILLGAALGFSAVVIAFILGAVYGLTLIFLRTIPLLRVGRGITMKSEVPFAPFLILGAWLSFWFQIDLFYVSTF